MLLLALTDSGSLGRHYIAMFEATQNVTLKPTETWREALLHTRVMDLFFTVSTPSITYCPAQRSAGSEMLKLELGLQLTTIFIVD